MIYKIIFIFIAGVIVDLLVTKYTDFVARRKIAKATALSGLITVVNFILLTLILKDSAANDLVSIIALASGNSLGTFFAMKKV
ncbi:MAG: hypothetical protein JW795_19885 [Chitinivibrionales bacterium]|nr:hypothetical protein [Chitinivibrionales bacterium]